MGVVGIDAGRHEVKAVGPNNRVRFRSKVGEYRQRRLTNGHTDYDVIIDGERWFVADLADESYCPREMATESKIHKESQVLCLTALALVLDPTDVRLNVTTGLPVTQHIPEAKEAFTKLIEGWHTVSFDNGKNINFLVESVGVVPEGGGAYWAAVLEGAPFASKKVRVVDIGSRTVNYCTLDSKRYIDRDSGTLNYGVMELNNASEEPDEELLEQFARRIVADLSQRWLGYRADREIVLLAGGGSLLLEKYLRKHFPLAQMSPDPVWANALGYYKMGLARQQRER